MSVRPQVLCLCLSGAVCGAEQHFNCSLTVWSVCSDTYLVSSSYSIPLEGLTVTDSGAEGGPCSELSWVGVLIFLFVSPDCGKLEASWNNSLSSLAQSSFLWDNQLPSVPYKEQLYCSLLLYVPGHLLQSIQAGQRPLILTLLNVTLSPPLHINNWRWHCRTPLLVVPLPFAAMNIHFGTTCHSCQDKSNFILVLFHWDEASKRWVISKSCSVYFPVALALKKKRENKKAYLKRTLLGQLWLWSTFQQTKFIAVIARVVC